MGEIYKWLLLHTGNEAPFYTVLNCQRSGTPDGIESIRVMARTKEFEVVNLVIGQPNGEGLAGNSPKSQSLHFADQQAVIDYLVTGDTESQTVPDSANGIQVWVEAPVGDSGSITFPPEQAP